MAKTAAELRAEAAAAQQELDQLAQEEANQLAKDSVNAAIADSIDSSESGTTLRHVSEIKTVSVLPYTYYYDAESKLKGKEYKRFKVGCLGGKLFTSGDEHLESAIREGDIKEITFSINAKGQLSLESYLTGKQLNRMLFNEALEQTLTIDNFKSKSIGELSSMF